MSRTKGSASRVAHWFTRVVPWLITVLLLWPERPAIAWNTGLLTNVGEIKNLTPSRAQLGYPVRVEGVITLSDAANYQTFLQDGTGGIYLQGGEELRKRVSAGDRVCIEGVAAPGLFAPVIAVHSVQNLGPALLPVPRRLAPGDLGAGSLDALYVESEGLVRSATAVAAARGSGEQIRIHLDTDSDDVTVFVFSPGTLDPESLIGATIRVRGPLGVEANKQGQLVEERILVDGNNADRLRVLRRESSDPFQSTPIPIGSLLRYRSVSSGARVHLQGFITLANNRFVILQNNGEGINVQTLGPINWPLGTFVDAVGFPALTAHGPILADAQVRFIAASHPIQPIDSTPQEASSGDREWTLIRVRGYLRDQFNVADHHVLLLESENLFISASLDKQVPAERLERMQEGSLLEITGVSARVPVDRQHASRDTHIYMRSLDDITVISPPSWWNGKHALQVLIVAGLLGIMVMSWNFILQQRVRRQTLLLKKTAQFERARNEILEMVGRNGSLDTILAQVCALTEKQIRGCRCSIGLHNRVPDPRSSWSTLIASATGEPLALFSVKFDDEKPLEIPQTELLHSMARLAGIAIEQRSLYDRLCHQSQRDALTGLANRLMLQENLAAALSKSRQAGSRVACLYLDLDGFKEVNDTLGHRAGDIVLKSIASRLAGSARDSDTVARIGGDEFCLVLPDLPDSSHAQEIAIRLIQAVEAPISVEDQMVNVSASIGISYFPDHAPDSDALCRCADAALYAMKSNGKAGYCVFEPEYSASLRIAS